MEKFLVIYHLGPSKQREALGGLGGYGGPHHCLIERATMADVLKWLADTLAPDVWGVEVHPIEAEIGQ